MKAARNARSEKHRFLIPALFLASAVLAGCGSEFSTNPLTGTRPQDEEVGELLLPTPGNGISAPKNLSASFSAPGTMDLTWTAPPQAYEAIVLRDGSEVGRVPAQGGTFSDTLPPRAPGVNEVTYTVCFGRGTQVGPESAVVGLLPRQEFTESNPGVDLVN